MRIPFAIWRLKHPLYYPLTIPIGLSLIGTLFFYFSTPDAFTAVFHNRWHPVYLLGSTFIHGGFLHLFMNALALFFIGYQLLLPALGRKRFFHLFIAAAVIALLANNFLSPSPAIGMSGALMGIVACAVYPCGLVPMRLFVIHDLIPRLPPFQYRYVVAALPMIDLCGIIFDWQLFAHWAHLGGFATGLVYGYLCFHRRLL